MIRLLNARTRTLAPPTRDEDRPPYAILSHVWGNARDEITFQQVSLADHGDFNDKPGYVKISKLCQLAVEYDLHHAWADTCCIDKTDYNVLSTALGYMFRWYREAEVCFVYLHDVVGEEDPAAEGSQFRNSKWFKRGWTLQELIAPRQVVFFNSTWNEIGTKSSLITTVTQITNIPSTVILMNHPGEMSIAQCMSWAAGRKTSRPEDRAYSLMGLLGVSIPMLYGEGDKAFERLQLELITRSDDQSIFAWTRDDNQSSGGLLARSPDDFRESHDICQVIDNGNDPAPYAMTNKGLRISLHLEPHDRDGNLNWATLNCRRSADRSLLRILLRRDGGPRTYKRVRFDQLNSGVITGHSITEVYIKEAVKRRFEISDWMRTEDYYLFVLRLPVAPHVKTPKDCASVIWTNTDDGIVLALRQSGHSGVLAFNDATKKRRLEICIGLHNWNAWCAILEDPSTHFKDFWTIKEIHKERWQNRDRQTFITAGNEKVSVKLTRGSRDVGEGRPRIGCWYVDIQFDEVRPHTLEELGHGCCYAAQ